MNKIFFGQFKQLQTCLIYGVVIVVTFFSLLQVFSVSTLAQSEQPGGAPVAGFANCSPEDSDLNEGSGAIIDCLRSVLNFVFIVAIFIAAFRFAAAGLGNYLPGSNVDAITEGRKAIDGVVIGLVLMGLPGLILNLINPAANLLDFLGGVVNAGEQVEVAPVGGANGNTGTAGGGNTGNGGGGGVDNAPTPTVDRNSVTLVRVEDLGTSSVCKGDGNSRFKLNFNGSTEKNDHYQCKNTLLCPGKSNLSTGDRYLYNTSTGILTCPPTTT